MYMKFSCHLLVLLDVSHFCVFHQEAGKVNTGVGAGFWCALHCVCGDALHL